MPLVLPAQIVVPPETEPPIDWGVIVIDEVLENALHAPLLTNALNSVVCVRFPGVKVALVFDMSVHEEPPLMLDCHLLIIPLFPESVSGGGGFPEQIVVPPAIEPAIAIASTVIVAIFE